MAQRDLIGHPDGDRVVVLAATKDGLYHFTSDTERRNWQRGGPYFARHDVNHASFDPRDGSLWAAANNGDARVYRSPDLGRTWEAKGSPFDATLVWHVEPGRIEEPESVYAGVMPAALYHSHDSGDTWEPVEGLNNHETRAEWWEGGGGLCLHTIILPESRPGRLYAGISVAGLFRSDDDGSSWYPVNEGVNDFVEMMSENGAPKHHTVHRCVHKAVVHPTDPDIMFQQNHLGAYRSRDGGLTWQNINTGLPSTFGFPIAIGAGPSPAIFVLPEDENTLRTPGHLAVWRSTDEGATWTECTTGLPAVETSVLREALATDNRESTGVYFGTRDGTLFASTDGGDTWQVLADDLPGVRSVKVAYAG
jgi:photosystem II stability/assembly factor-like uncharacterized protein